MHFLSDYGLFLVKLASVVIAILVILTAFFALIAKAKGKAKGKLDIHKLNEKFEDYGDTVLHAVKTKHELKKIKKTQKQSKKKQAEKKQQQKNVFVLNFHGDIKASAVTALREEITALLMHAEPKKDEVLVRLESGGGLVHAYGLATSQLQRIRDAKIKLTIAIDTIAASGGYMMACVADRIIAAPFAIIGSIGVVAQLPNFHRYLQKKSIDFEQLTAGEYKRTLTLFGENTEKGRDKMKQEIEETHVLFKSFISRHRPEIDINEIATGEHWYAARAIDFKLVDDLTTSDDYLLSASKANNIYEIEYKIKKPFTKRLTSGASNLYHKLLHHDLQTSGQDYL